MTSRSAGLAAVDVGNLSVTATTRSPTLLLVEDCIGLLMRVRTAVSATGRASVMRKVVLRVERAAHSSISIVASNRLTRSIAGLVNVLDRRTSTLYLARVIRSHRR